MTSVFEMKDLKAMQLDSWTTAYIRDHWTNLAFLEREQLGRTIWTSDGKTVLGMMGLAPIGPRVGEVFVLADPEARKKHPAAFAKAIRRELRLLLARFDRIQALGTNDKASIRWLSWLGFQCEGKCGRRGVEGDRLMWAIEGGGQ